MDMIFTKSLLLDIYTKSGPIMKTKVSWYDSSG